MDQNLGDFLRNPECFSNFPVHTGYTRGWIFVSKENNTDLLPPELNNVFKTDKCQRELTFKIFKKSGTDDSWLCPHFYLFFNFRKIRYFVLVEFSNGFSILGISLIWKWSF